MEIMTPLTLALVSNRVWLRLSYYARFTIRVLVDRGPREMSCKEVASFRRLLVIGEKYAPWPNFRSW